MGTTTLTKEEILSEHELVEAAKRDSKHFGDLYKKYFNQIFRYIFRRVDDMDVSGDITQEVFLEALNTLHRYEYRGVPFSAWLYRIATSRVTMYFRSHTRQRCISLDSPDIAILFQEIDTHETSENVQNLVNCLKQLGHDDLQLIELRFRESCSFKEIGEILDITENNAKVKTYRILGKLKKIMVR